MFNILIIGDQDLIIHEHSEHLSAAGYHVYSK